MHVLLVGDAISHGEAVAVSLPPGLELRRAADLDAALVALGEPGVAAVVILGPSTESGIAEAVARVRAETSGEARPIVALLAPPVTPDAISTVVEAGVDAAVALPIAPHALRAAVAPLLRQHRAHLAEQARAEALADRVRRNDALLRAVVHDLKNPLGSTLSNLEYLAPSLEELSADAREAASDALSGLRQALGLVEDLAVLARAEDAPVTIDRRPVRLQELVAELAERVRPDVARRGLRLEIPPSPIAGSLVADRRLLVRALEDLVTNAMRLTPRGGTVRVGLRVDATVRITVARTGLPYAPELRPRLFDRFARLESSAAGPGLGLYFGRRVVEAHGGALSLVEAEGFAACFVLDLPVAPNADVEARDAHVGVPPDGAAGGRS